MAEDTKKFGVVTSSEAEKRKAAEAAAKAAADKAAQEKLLAERAAAAKLAEFEAGRRIGKVEGIAIGKHEAGHKNIWKGMGFAYASMLVAWLAMLGYDMSLSENKRAERFMAVREAEHTRDILNESAAMKAPVVEPDPVK